MTKETPTPNTSREIQLNEEEASQLAETLKEQLREGKTPSADEEQIKKMIAGLGDPRGLLRRTFAESLGAAGAVTLPALKAALLSHPNVTVRRAAAKTLRLVGDPRALPHLLEALINDPDPVVQGSSAGAMAVFGEDAVGLLEKVLTNPKSTALQCGLASWGLSFVGAEAPTALLKAAASNHPSVRAAAIAALGDQIHSCDDKQAKILLLKALEDPISDVRIEAAILLGKLNNPQWAYQLLLIRLNDENSQVRKNAALSIMKLHIIKAIGPLIVRLKIESDQEVIKIITLAIKQLGLNQ